jgi:hypothetical protein
MPFKDFTALASGSGTFDFVHLKDWTFVDMKPLGQPFVMSNMKLIACNPNPSTTTAPPKATASTGPLQSGSTSAIGQGLTVILGTLGFIYLVFAL